MRQPTALAALALLGLPAVHGAGEALRGSNASGSDWSATSAARLDAAGLAGFNPAVPPSVALGYNGVAWPAMVVPGPGPTHVFAIGDWGGMDGAFEPGDGRSRIIAYPGGETPGPHVFPRSRPGCGHQDLVDCFWPGRQCKAICGFVEGVDDNAQRLVAAQFKLRAAQHDPKYILNVGDNFYWGGIERNCGSPMDQIAPQTRHQFDSIFEGIYAGPGLDGKKWLSVLGNHDWGGRVFNNGWDQQIAYTWASPRWVLPAAYYSQRVDYPNQGFSAEYFMIDSNAMDAMPRDMDPEHNICGAMHNPPGASCAVAGGPSSLDACRDWFWGLWTEQQRWLEARLSASTADWQIVVTHFPCGHEAEWYKMLHNSYGLDLLVTGHRHDQELWKANGILGGLTCFVTGGGGGITSEHSVLPNRPTDGWPNVVGQYGFFDLTITRDEITVEAIDYTGTVADTTRVLPKSRR